MIFVYIILYIIVFLSGLAIGSAVTKSRVKKKNTHGVLKNAYDPNDDQTYLFLELNPDSPPQVLVTKKWVIFDVDNQQIISHK